MNEIMVPFSTLILSLVLLLLFSANVPSNSLRSIDWLRSDDVMSSRMDKTKRHHEPKRFGDIFSSPLAPLFPPATERATNKSRRNFEEKAQLSDQQQILMDVQFATHDFDEKFDPRNPASAFRFNTVRAASGLKSDNAAFAVQKSEYSPHLLDMISLPFSHWLPQVPPAIEFSTGLSNFQVLLDGIAPQKAFFEAWIRAKAPLIVNTGQILSVAYRFTCHTMNMKDIASKFPKEAILDYQDDPRLGACAVTLADETFSGVEFAIYATNNGIWAKYSVSSSTRYINNGTYSTFDIYRRIGERRSSAHADGIVVEDELIDARIEIDRSQSREVRFYLNDRVAWRVQNLGIFFPEDLINLDKNARLVSYRKGAHPRKIEVEPDSYTLYVGNARKMDEADPNRQALDGDGKWYSPALVRPILVPEFYGKDVKFYDEYSERENNIAGQGVISGMERLLVTVRNTTTAPTTTTSSSSALPSATKKQVVLTDNIQIGTNRVDNSKLQQLNATKPSATADIKGDDSEQSNDNFFNSQLYA